jgi:hypothetical protein
MVWRALSPLWRPVYCVEGTFHWVYGRGPPPQEKKYQLMAFGGKNMKRGREKGGKCKRKMKKRERKEKGERKIEEMGSKRNAK